MRLLYLVIFILLFSSHGNQDASHYTRTDVFEFKLIDGLGTVSIAFPQRMDTFFSWIQRSDCGKPCEYGDYRFQSKKNRIFKESGFFWTGEPEDSVDQLSIYHLRTDTLFKFDDSDLLKSKDWLKETVLNDFQTANVISDTMLKIGDRHFYIFEVASITSEKKIRHRRLIAFTSVSGSDIKFCYKLLTKNYDTVLTSFFDRAIENLKTVQIKDGG